MRRRSLGTLRDRGDIWGNAVEIGSPKVVTKI